MSEVKGYAAQLNSPQNLHIRLATSGRRGMNEEALSWGNLSCFSFLKNLLSSLKSLVPWWCVSGTLQRAVEYTFHP
ncbi:MAG TPA: hypothetical protein VGQ12_17075 [Candidatus Angelobacter sp.]|nr:hypothetical protein [Candidatus Angelobacter sp.]